MEDRTETALILIGAGHALIEEAAAKANALDPNRAAHLYRNAANCYEQAAYLTAGVADHLTKPAKKAAANATAIADRLTY